MGTHRYVAFCVALENTRVIEIQAYFHVLLFGPIN
jgi:hypothetical protein